MQALLGPVDKFMSAVGKMTGEFDVEMAHRRGEDRNSLTAVGLLINNIISSCVFRPPKTPTEIRVEHALLAKQNANLPPKDRLEGLEHFPAPNEDEHTPKKYELLCKLELHQANKAELERHQENFNPIGGLTAAALLLLTAQSVSNWVGNNFVPYIVRENFKLGTKCMSGSTMFVLILESIQGWARHTDGQKRTVSVRCSI
ncbi:MAG: hypothetical protein HRU43_03255 [Simkaniaceae bacterium]|nr:hypothetical protein [Simkaniaceae bacterium]